jgi:hypothetical protein
MAPSLNDAAAVVRNVGGSVFAVSATQAVCQAEQRPADGPTLFPLPQRAPHLPQSSSASRLTKEYDEHQGGATAYIQGTSRRPIQRQKQG